MLRRSISVLVVLVPIGLWAATPSALAAGDANQASCSPATEASPGFRTYLPDCRAYEMVSPPYKGGGVISGFGISVSSDGSRVMGVTTSAFAGTQDDLELDAYYEFEREASGWVTSPLSPPASLFPEAHPPNGGLPLSSDLGASLWNVTTTPALGAEEYLYLEPSPDASLVPVGPEQPPPSTGGGFDVNLSFVGASGDLTHTLFNIVSPSIRQIETGQNRPWPGDTTIPGAPSLYEYVGTGNTEPVLVGVSNQEQLHGKPHINEGAALISQCGTTLGGVHNDVYNAVSGSGGTVFFTAHSGPCEESGVQGAGPNVNELYARIDGTRTVALSEPSLPAGECSSGEPCFGAEPKEGIFEGASENGERVFFVSEQPLVNGAVATGIKLYEARLEGATVAEVMDVSADRTARQSPEVQGVARVSEDGSHVYFVAKGVLTSEARGGGCEAELTAAELAEEESTKEGRCRPRAGADNLYVFDTDEPGQPKFVATLLVSEAEATKIEEEALNEAIEALGQCDGASSCNSEVLNNYSSAIAGIRGVWSPEDQRPVQATPDGRFLVFSSWERLTSGDESKGPQVFEYDAETEKLVRVSIGHGGYNSDGNISGIADAPRIPVQNYTGADLPTTTGSSLAVSNDGSRVFFESMDSLAPEAVTGATNVYEYREGDAYLISDGQDAGRSANGPTTKLIGTDGSGRDVFFTTEDRLVPEDTDTLLNVFDAREAGGFPAPSSVAPCSGDACQGPLGAPPLLPSLGGSSTQAGGGNVTPAVPVPAKPKPLTRPQKLAKALKACKAKRKKQRAACEKQARKQYAPAKKVGKR